MIGFGPPVVRFGRISRFLIPPCMLISMNTVASDELMPSSGEVPTVTLASMKTTFSWMDLFPVGVVCFFFLWFVSVGYN